MSNPDLNLLRVFDLVYTTGAVTQAAEQLNMTPPAVSQAISRLSQHIGQPLFVRQGRGIKPTAAAISLRKQITPHLSFLEQSINTNQSFDPATSTRSFCIGSEQNHDVQHIKRTHQLIKSSAPNITCEWAPNLYREEERHEALRSRSADLIITTSPLNSPGFHDEEITEDRLVAVCAQNHPRKNQVECFDGFFKESHTAMRSGRMKRLFMDSLALQPVPDRNIVYKSDSMLTLMAMAANTDWICICSEAIAREFAEALQLHTFELPFETHKLPIYLSWHSSRNEDAGLQWLVSIIKQGFEVD